MADGQCHRKQYQIFSEVVNMYWIWIIDLLWWLR
jgi:hypothetical protein